MQKNLLIALAIVGTLTAGFFLFRNKPTQTVDVNQTALKDIYNQWKVNYKINVGASEDTYRFKVFTNTYQDITRHNKLLGRGYNKGLNAFSHLTDEEFAATHLGAYVRNTSVTNFANLTTDNLRTSVDWRAKMNPIKNQGQCGSCWAFSAVGAIEGAHSVFKGQLFNLSEQELVDCSGGYGNMGCNGGNEDQGIQYAVDNGGLATEADYPYTATDGTCQTRKKTFTKYGKVAKVNAVARNSPKALMAALDKQPTTVAVQANAWKSYSSGIFSDASCGTSLNHAVIAVGYNTEGQTPYYIVRNSWGPNWGEAGHIKVAIQDGKGVCGINMEPFYPSL